MRMIALIALASLYSASAALAQATPPAPLTEYTLHVNSADITAIGMAINELPKRVADPLIAKLQSQIDAQNARAAAPPPPGPHMATPAVPPEAK